MDGRGAPLAGRYRLEERIGAGGMGEVWRGTDEVLGRTVAVKVMLAALLAQEGFAERFRGEARTMANLNHPGVVNIYDYYGDAESAFLVMEYVEGETLSGTLGRVGRLTASRAMALMAQAADALQAAHDNGIVHRDVKPGNLLVRPDGTLVLTDFGIARSDLVGQLTATGMMLGTAAYLSPEQAGGERATTASDLYALGVVAYQCLAGRRPFEGDNAVELAMRHLRDTPPPLPGDVPPSVRDVVVRAMAKDPTQRWVSARQLAAAAREAHGATSAAPAGSGSAGGVYRAGLAQVGDGPVPYATATEAPTPRAPAPVRDRRSGVWIAAVVLTVLAVLLCAGLVGYLARLVIDGDLDRANLPFMIMYAHEIEGSTTR